MTEAFVPFAPERPGPRAPDQAFRVVILPQPEGAASAFVPSHPGRLPHASPASAPHPPGEPEIQLDRDGDRITRITVRCSCGQVIELNCTS